MIVLRWGFWEEQNSHTASFYVQYCVSICVPWRRTPTIIQEENSRLVACGISKTAAVARQQQQEELFITQHPMNGKFCVNRDRGGRYMSIKRTLCASLCVNNKGVRTNITFGHLEKRKRRIHTRESPIYRGICIGQKRIGSCWGESLLVNGCSLRYGWLYMQELWRWWRLSLLPLFQCFTYITHMQNKITMMPAGEGWMKGYASREMRWKYRISIGVIKYWLRRVWREVHRGTKTCVIAQAAPLLPCYLSKI